MTVFVLVLALLFEGEVHMAVYNAGNRDKAHEFKSRAACEKERTRQLTQMDKILAPGATLLELVCVQRNAEGGA